MQDATLGDKELEQLIIRPAKPEDVMDLLRWRNEAHVRAMSRHNDIIDDGCHRRWYERALTSSDKLLLIGVLSGQSIGMVRFDRHQFSMWEISIMLAPESRGQRISRTFLEKSICLFCTMHPESSVLAVIKKCNTPSLHLFKSLNFARTSEDSEFTNHIFRPPR